MYKTLTFCDECKKDITAECNRIIGKKYLHDIDSNLAQEYTNKDGEISFYVNSAQLCMDCIKKDLSTKVIFEGGFNNEV